MGFSRYRIFMVGDYQIVSPSLEGVLCHESLAYERLKRPVELLYVLDGPRSKGPSMGILGNQELKMLEDYFHDLYGVFMKKLSHFIVEPDSRDGDSVKLQAMLQEMIKVKRLMGK